MPTPEVAVFPVQPMVEVEEISNHGLYPLENTSTKLFWDQADSLIHSHSAQIKIHAHLSSGRMEAVSISLTFLTVSISLESASEVDPKLIRLDLFWRRGQLPWSKRKKKKMMENPSKSSSKDVLKDASSPTTLDQAMTFWRATLKVRMSSTLDGGHLSLYWAMKTVRKQKMDTI